MKASLRRRADLNAALGYAAADQKAREGHRHLVGRKLTLAALDDILENGTLADWRPVLALVRRAPYAAVATRLDALLDRRDYGADGKFWRAFIDAARAEQDVTKRPTTANVAGSLARYGSGTDIKTLRALAYRKRGEQLERRARQWQAEQASADVQKIAKGDRRVGSRDEIDKAEARARERIHERAVATAGEHAYWGYVIARGLKSLDEGRVFRWDDKTDQRTRARLADKTLRATDVKCGLADLRTGRVPDWSSFAEQLAASFHSDERAAWQAKIDAAERHHRLGIRQAREKIAALEAELAQVRKAERRQPARAEKLRDHIERERSAVVPESENDAIFGCAPRPARRRRPAPST